MSLGDYIRYLRALKGGPALWEVSTATGVRTDLLRQIEQRYSEVSDDDSVARLAAYYGVDPNELTSRRPFFRKLLSGALEQSLIHKQRLHVILRSGHEFTGIVRWWDLGAALFDLGDGDEVVIQRHMVDQWHLVDEVRTPESLQAEPVPVA